MEHESVPLYWRNIPAYYRLVARRCKRCGEVYFPPVLKCPRCGSNELEDVELPQEGELVEFTVLRSVPTDFLKQKPVILGLVKLGPAKVLGQIVDAAPEKLKEGQRVEVAFRRVVVDGKYGLVMYGYKFRPRP
ncbi:MAG: Zn-ribbon domain-containing OB-fold protein [Thermoproteus sp. AZ2]|jgi:uncharacterized OB-fold protein|uniref:Zn-ribbon domain-containing OB-fold protein n=1 Tax=Thermoproteus sp. AZ2 TaxID=1609232 RepID=A0ACC6V1R9_9CREN|nr:MAG: cobalt transporter ApaG [Thermoproteus sp. AZ2]